MSISTDEVDKLLSIAERSAKWPGLRHLHDAAMRELKGHADDAAEANAQAKKEDDEATAKEKAEVEAKAKAKAAAEEKANEAGKAKDKAKERADA